MRVLGATMAALFVLSIAVQWNDPDPLPWMGFYGLAAVSALGVAFERSGRAWRGLEWATLLLALAVVVGLAPSLGDARSEAFTSFRMRAAADEAPREWVGAAIVLAWAGVAVGWRRRTTQHRR